MKETGKTIWKLQLIWEKPLIPARQHQFNGFLHIAVEYNECL